MREMIFFEWKKIFDRRFNVIAMVVGYILILVCSIYFIKDTFFYEVETDTYIYGISAYRLSQEKNEARTEYLTEEFLTELTAQVQAINIPLDTDEGYVQVIRPNSDLLWVLCNAYIKEGEYIEWDRLNEIPIEGGIHFYERRLEKIKEFLNRDFSFGNYSDAEKEFWLSKAKEVESPFQWGDKNAMDTVWLTIQISFYLLFVIAICIAPVFAAEYETGAASILLTTANGRTKLVTAKILASILFSLLYMSIGIGIPLAIEGIAIGFSGRDLPIQLWGVSIPYNISVGGACVISLIIILLIVLAITLLTLVWSFELKTSIIVLVLDFVLLIGPAFLPMSKDVRLWNQINFLFPIRAMSVKDVLMSFNSYQFGNIIFSYIEMILIVYFLVTLACLVRIKRRG